MYYYNQIIDIAEGSIGFEMWFWQGERGWGGEQKKTTKKENFQKRGGGGQSPPVAIKLPQAGMSQNSQRLLGSVV